MKQGVFRVAGREWRQGGPGSGGGPLWGMEIDPDKAKEEIRSFAGRNEGKVGSPRALLWI
jgi:hypothetical protein